MRRPGQANRGNQRSDRASLQAPRAVRSAGRAAAEGRFALRPARHGENAPRARRRAPHGLLVHPAERVGAGAEVHRRGRAHGARAVRERAVGEEMAGEA